MDQERSDYAELSPERMSPVEEFLIVIGAMGAWLLVVIGGIVLAGLLK